MCQFNIRGSYQAFGVLCNTTAVSEVWKYVKGIISRRLFETYPLWNYLPESVFQNHFFFQKNCVWTKYSYVLRCLLCSVICSSGSYLMPKLPDVCVTMLYLTEVICLIVLMTVILSAWFQMLFYGVCSGVSQPAERRTLLDKPVARESAVDRGCLLQSHWITRDDSQSEEAVETRPWGQGCRVAQHAVNDCQMSVKIDHISQYNPPPNSLLILSSYIKSLLIPKRPLLVPSYPTLMFLIIFCRLYRQNPLKHKEIMNYTSH